MPTKNCIVQPPFTDMSFFGIAINGKLKIIGSLLGSGFYLPF